jgi:hypothetical protein
VAVAEHRGTISLLAIGAVPEDEENAHIRFSLDHSTCELESGHLLHLSAANERGDTLCRILDQALAGSRAGRMKHLVPGGTQGSKKSNPLVVIVVGYGNEGRIETAKTGPLRAASTGRNPAWCLVADDHGRGKSVRLDPRLLSS